MRCDISVERKRRSREANCSWSGGFYRHLAFAVRKRKKIPCPFSPSKKPKRWKFNETEEFSVERALRNLGLFCDQDEKKKKSVGLCLISLPFSSYGLFCRKKRPHWQYQTLRGSKKNQTQYGKSQTFFFEGDVWENISDVNRLTPIIHARTRTNLSKAVFLGISFNITST